MRVGTVKRDGHNPSEWRMFSARTGRCVARLAVTIYVDVLIIRKSDIQ